MSLGLVLFSDLRGDRESDDRPTEEDEVVLYRSLVKRRFDGSDWREMPYVIEVVYVGASWANKKIAAPRNFAYDLVAENRDDAERATAVNAVQE